jgi:hypothetical protein
MLKQPLLLLGRLLLLPLEPLALRLPLVLLVILLLSNLHNNKQCTANSSIACW